MNLKTRIEVLPCGMCEEMMGCDTCLYSKEAHDLYYQIRAEVIEKFAEKIRAYSGEHYIDCDGYGCSTDLVFMTDAFLDDIVEQLKEQNK